MNKNLSMKEIIDNLWEGITFNINERFKSAPFDKTDTAIIKGISEFGYIVDYNNNLYSDIKTIGGTCSINETVKIMIPQNNMSNMFILKSNTISNIISSGLSCTWGNLVGGYVRHGNINGTAMITIQLAVTLTTALTVGQTYSISGFPSTIVDTAVCCHAMDIFDRCHLGSVGTIYMRVKGTTAVGNIIVLNCTYLHI